MRIVNFLSVALISATIIMSSCDKKEKVAPSTGEQKEAVRTKIDYSLLTDNTPYNNSLFVDANGDSTVDRTSGSNRFYMFKALNTYAGSSNNTGTAVQDVNVLKNMFRNSGFPFTVNYAFLNTTGLQLRNVTGSSLSPSDAADVRSDMDGFFAMQATASASVNDTAKIGKAGKLYVGGGSTSAYLVGADGIEYGQVIQKGLIGGFQLDYISNILLDRGLSADNYSLVLGRNYTQLEHNWDEAFGVLTPNQIYNQNATVTTKASPAESFIGSYIWEYNKDAFAKIHPAFVRGRAAIVNNDMDEVKKQASYIRNQMEKTIAMAALGYLDKWKTSTTDAARAHAMGEGTGFIYSLRFCKLNGCDSKFSDDILNALLYSSANGFWDLDVTKINAASATIKAKFGL